jgi:4-amino-4-deoxy-L-arabinose transferase-like glycosyltransferase
MTKARRLVIGGGAILAAWLIAFVSVVRRPVVRSDEAWFLWVAVRANSGTPLYRGVYFVTTPLAMWCMQLGAFVFGTHVAVERALTSACFAASLALVWVIARRFAVPTHTRALIGVAMFVWAAPATHFTSVYSMLAVTLSLGALLALMSCATARDAGRSGLGEAVATGVLVGAACAAKPNIGVVALLAVVASLVGSGLLSRSRVDGAGLVGAVALGFTGTMAATMLPFVINGSLGNLVGDVFLGKGSTYFSVEEFGYGGASQLLLVGAVAFVVFGLRRAPTPTRRALVAPSAFVVVGLVAAAPDFRAQHLTEAFPLLALAAVVLAAAYAAHPLAPRQPRRWMVVLSVVAAVAVVAAMGWWTYRPPGGRPDAVVADRSAHFTGSLTTAASAAKVRSDLTELRRDTGGTVFLAFIDAGYYYLAGRLRNPTAYDYPGRSDLGPGGERGAILVLRRRHVQWVCVRRPTPSQSKLVPSRLETFVRAEFRFVDRLNVCDLYRAADAPPAS